MLKSAAVAYVVLCLTGAVLATPWKRDGLGMPANMHINLCLIACGVCFDSKSGDPVQDAVMMECANDVCLGDLNKGGLLKSIWKKDCPQLAKVWEEF